MNVKRISLVSGAAFLAVAGTASARPMAVASSQVITPPIQTEQIQYDYRHHYRHYGWHYGWYRQRYHYGWCHHRHYGWNPPAAVADATVGLATLPFALATGAWPYYGYPYYYY